MSIADVELKLIEFWKGVKKRAYTYKEKKRNRLGDYDLFLDCFGEEIDSEKIRDLIEEKEKARISERRSNRLKKMLEDKVNRENYEKELQTEEGLFVFMIGLRDELPFGLTNSEAYALTIHYTEELALQSKADTIPRPITEERDDEIMLEVIGRFVEDWPGFMDSVARAKDLINAVVAEHFENTTKGNT